ncbi:MAG: ankyrin repeat domain-containing protein [bacterium]
MISFEKIKKINLKYISQTPLHRAALYGKKECVKVLLDYGADKDIKNVSFFLL